MLTVSSHVEVPLEGNIAGVTKLPLSSSLLELVGQTCSLPWHSACSRCSSGSVLAMRLNITMKIYKDSREGS